MVMSLETDPRVGERRRWVSEGIRVWAPTGIADVNGRFHASYSVCDVVVAAGNHARVKSVKEGKFEGWMPVEELYDFVKPNC